mgnify:CR=1 FL=1
MASTGRATRSTPSRSCIDEDALIELAASGQIGFAALDVTTVEPLPADSPLWDLPNVLVAPHTAANSEKEDARIAELFIDNVRAFIDGRRLRNVVDTELFY